MYNKSYNIQNQSGFDKVPQIGAFSNYIIQNKASLRNTAIHFGMGKTTVFDAQRSIISVFFD